MKKTIFFLTVIIMLTVSVHAETVGRQSETDPGMMTGHGQMMCPKMKQMQGQGMIQGGQQMMQMCHMMGRGIMGHGMMARDMMQIMTDMIKMQQKIIRGLSPVEKSEMVKDADKMLERLDKMMSDMRGMMMHGMMEQPSPPPFMEPEEKVTEKEFTPKTDPHKH